MMTAFTSWAQAISYLGYTTKFPGRSCMMGKPVNR
jgi:hypothetical protein